MRIEKLAIEDFRRFQRFTMKDMGRVNLIVGTNNCGKTTVLEAINMLMSQGNLATIWTMHNRRGEITWLERDDPAAELSRQYEVRRLFRGYEVTVGSSFRLSATTDVGPAALEARIEEYDPAEPEHFQPPLLPSDIPQESISPLSLSLSWSNGEPRDFHLPLSRPGTVGADAFNRAARGVGPHHYPVRLVTASSLAADVVSKLFDDIVLTPEEDLVIETLRIIDPTIERLASAGLDRIPSIWHHSPRAGLFVRQKDVKDRVPIGSMGDGIWRILGLALFVVHSRNGILLVDDIDTGLHHTIMEDIWKFLYVAATQHNVQVFATTHSRDSYESLAAICRDSVADNSDVTIQRIERGREEAVAYTEQEIIAAAARDIEVR